ncbi:MAG: hypothetical protein BGO76_01910 [Caedibacter sp. 38-128]|nr:glycosyltransferase [Holosporales bacterium]OJX08498.1 MAG: hypothetical protein BGO76_01910 [Caedibacter sp. 38-128]
MSTLANEREIFYLCLEPVREGHASYTHVVEIIQGLKKLGWKVKLFNPTYDDKKLPSLYQRILGMMKAQWRLMQLKKHPSLLYIRCHPFSFITALWARWKGIKVFQEVNGTYEDLFIAWPWTRYVSFLFKALYQKQFQWADHVIVVTNGLEKFVKQEAGHDRITVISNGVNTTLFNRNVKTNCALPAQFVIFFGTFSRWHGISLLLNAVDNPEWPQGVKLVFIGDGIERVSIENKVKNSDKVMYLGRKPYREVGGIVAKAIAGLVPIQNVEDRALTGLAPLKLFETIACGVPVIVSEQPEQADFVRENKCGSVVGEQTPEAWAKAVKAVTQQSIHLRLNDELLNSVSWREKVKKLNALIMQKISL